MEQVRWVLGGLLEIQDLHSTWPIRVVFTKEGAPAKIGFEWQNGQYLLVCPEGTHVPLGQVAGILLDANTPRLPAEVELGLRELFSTLQANGSRVTWGSAPAHPDLAWARMQLFATNFNYGASFHIFLASLRSGSSIRDAETNAFAKPENELEREVKANLAAGNWQATPVSGRPLDPKRDLGEQPLTAEIADIYIADAKLRNEPQTAESAYRAAVNAGGTAAVLGLEGLARAAELEKRDPLPFLKDAIAAGSKSAPVYVMAAQNQPPAQSLRLLRKAAELNPLWAKPVYLQAKLASNAQQREALLKQAVQLDPRATEYWIDLAQVETGNGEGSLAQGSWLRAEQSAATPAESARIHRMQTASEQQRLNAEEAAARRESEAADDADEQAQNAEMARIEAAEKAANQEVTAIEGSPPPEKAIAWAEAFPHKRIAGTLVALDCGRTEARLSIKGKDGKITRLLVRDGAHDGLTCGPQRPERRAVIVYAAQADPTRQTAGIVMRLQLR